MITALVICAFGFVIVRIYYASKQNKKNHDAKLKAIQQQIAKNDRAKKEKQAQKQAQKKESIETTE